jgi:multidrug efflux system outer membrane protein
MLLPRSLRLPLAAAALAGAVVTTAPPLRADGGAGAGAGAGPAAAGPTTSGWWEQLEDPTLSALVQQALRHNGDVRAASARADATGAARFTALSPTLPVISIEANGTAQPLDTLGFQFRGLFGSGGGGAPPPEGLFYFGTAQLQARATVDLGQSALAFAAGSDDLDASLRDRDALVLNLGAEVARAWYDLVAARAQWRALQAQVETAEQLGGLVQLRFEQGDATALDVFQQRQQVAATRALLPPARAQVGANRQRLAALLATDADALDLGDDALPVAVPLPPPWRLPSDVDAVVQDRPDLAAARARVDAARARTTAAWLAFLPKLTLQANAGTQAVHVTETTSQGIWTAGAGLSIPLFSAGRNLASLRQAEASERASAESLRQLGHARTAAVLQASIQEDELSQQVQATQAQADAAVQALDEARSQYTAGLVTFQAVLLAQQAVLQSELSLIAARRNLLGARIALWDALGRVPTLSSPPTASSFTTSPSSFASLTAGEAP